MSTTKEMKDELIPLIVSRLNHSRPHFSTEEQEAINKKYGFQEYTEKLYHCSCGSILVKQVQKMFYNPLLFAGM